MHAVGKPFARGQEIAKRRAPAQAVAGRQRGRRRRETEPGEEPPSRERSRHQALLRRQAIAPGDHGADLVDGTSKRHHRQVNHDEDHERHGGDEMNRARRLTPAKQLGQPAPGGVERGRHRHARQYHQGQQQQHYDDVAEFLQRVVAACRRAFREVEPCVALDVVPQVAGTELAGSWQQIAPQVAIDRAPQCVKDGAGCEKPCERQVPSPRQREVVGRRNRGPPRERPRLHSPIAVPPGAQETGGLDRDAADPQEAAAAFMPDFEPGGIGVGAGLSPVEARMGVEDHQPAHQHDEQDHGV